jgi:hypothetical protein
VSGQVSTSEPVKVTVTGVLALVVTATGVADGGLLTVMVTVAVAVNVPSLTWYVNESGPA